MIVENRCGLVFHRVGTGKTRIALETFATLQQRLKWVNPCVSLVVCRRKAFMDWRQEIIKLGHDWNIVEDDLEMIRKKQNFLNRPTILLVSHAMLPKIWEYVLSYSYWVRMMIVDEGYLLKNPRAKMSRACNKIAKEVHVSVILSGSIMTARDPTDVYGQAFAINRHKHLANSLTGFRSEYLTKFTLRPKPGAYENILKKLSSITDVYFPTNNTRRIKEQVFTIPATKEQTAAFASLREWYELEDLGIELTNVLQVANKIQTISNGWVKDNDGNFISIKSNKPEHLLSVVEELREQGERVLIWCAFVHDVDMLRSYLPFATLQMSSQHDFDLDDWKSGKTTVAIATEASGSSINHFADTAYAIYFSMDAKWLNLQQSMGRTNRRSSQHSTCFYYYLQVEGSLDSRIYHLAKTSQRTEDKLVLLGELKHWLQNK